MAKRVCRSIYLENKTKRFTVTLLAAAKMTHKFSRNCNIFIFTSGISRLYTDSSPPLLLTPESIFEWKSFYYSPSHKKEEGYKYMVVIIKQLGGAGINGGNNKCGPPRINSRAKWGPHRLLIT